MTEIIGFPDYTINENGEIYNKKRKIIMKQNLDNTGYFHIGLTNNKIRTQLLIHRLVYQMFNLKSGETMPAEIDHKNNIKTDNFKDNLRPATSSQNQWNKGKKITNTSGHKNIHITQYGTFRVEIRRGNGMKYYKNFKTLVEAINDRNIKLKEFHGEFANNG